MKQLWSSLAMLGAVFLWASSATLSKLALNYVSGPELVAFRILGAALVLWLVVLCFLKGPGWQGPAPLIMGIFEPGLVTFFIIAALNHTSAVNAAVVWGIMPITQPILGRLILGESIEKSLFIAAPLAVTGVVMLFILKHQNGSGDLYGDFLLICAVAAASTNQMLARKTAIKNKKPIMTTAWQLVTASILALLYFLFTTPLSSAYAIPNIGVFLLLCSLIICTAGPFLLYNYSLQFISVGRISLFAPLTGPIGVVFATLVFGEALEPLILLAIALAISGAFLPTLVSLKRSRESNYNSR